MIQVRDVFQVKFGKIDQAVDLFSNLPSQVAKDLVTGRKLELMTDVSGQMYTVVETSVHDTLSDWAIMREELFQQHGFDQWFRQFQLFIEGGRREYYNIETPLQTWSRPGVVVVREAYRAYKWQIRNAVELLKRYGGLLVDRGVGMNPRILTDASGQMFTAVVEIETESMSAWETSRRDLFRQVEFQVWFNQMTVSVEAGMHEFFRVEYAGT